MKAIDIVTAWRDGLALKDLEAEIDVNPSNYDAKLQKTLILSVLSIEGTENKWLLELYDEIIHDAPDGTTKNKAQFNKALWLEERKIEWRKPQAIAVYENLIAMDVIDHGLRSMAQVNLAMVYVLNKEFEKWKLLLETIESTDDHMTQKIWSIQERLIKKEQQWKGEQKPVMRES
jgi:hypothetical protein